VQKNKAYHHIAPSKRAQGGEGPLQDQIRAQTRGRQAHNRGKITSTLCKTILGQVTSLPRGHPPKMEVVEPSQGVGAPHARPTSPISRGLPHIPFLRSVAEVSSRFNVPKGRFGTFHLGIKNIPWDQPLLSTYKRRPPPSHFNSTQNKSTRAREEQHHSWTLVVASSRKVVGRDMRESSRKKCWTGW
jgi:hypothetical protein